jgi:carbamoyltransferase
LKILGISAYYHDSAAAIVVDGRIIAAAQEERFSRIKNDASFPAHAIQFCLEQSCLNIDDLDAVVFYDKPFLKFERLLETYLHYAPHGIFPFVKSMPVWINEKLFIKKQIRKGLKQVQRFNSKKLKLLFTDHHLAHAASAFFASPFEKAAIVTLDGVGEWATASISVGEGNNIRMLHELHFPHSIGLLYSSFTYFLGFKVNSGEYKLMGLAPYGNRTATSTQQYIEKITSQLVTIKEDGSIGLNMKFFSFPSALKMIPSSRWEKLFGLKRLRFGEEATQEHCNLAYAIQKVTEDIVLKLVQFAKQKTSCENLCLAGGVALNCVANGKILNADIFKEIFIQPAAGDAGGALGAALAVNYMYFGNERIISMGSDLMQGAYLGPAVDEKDIAPLKREFKANSEEYNSFDEIYPFIANLIGQGKVVGWVQDRMEFGPRALGNRSILADARNTEMQRKLNLKIKYREGFRPFAPSVAEEDTSKYFDIDVPSPYMLLVADVREEYRNVIPESYPEMNLWEKLYMRRSEFQPITHVDFSARLHTVNKNTNEKFWKLLQAVKAKSGHAMLVNTSFNVRGEPIVCSARDAYLCFMNTEMDALVIDRFVFYKEAQYKFDDRNYWKLNFTKD